MLSYEFGTEWARSTQYVSDGAFALACSQGIQHTAHSHWKNLELCCWRYRKDHPEMSTTPWGCG